MSTLNDSHQNHFAGNSGQSYRLADLNVEADASDHDDDEDGIDWEEG